MAGRPAQFHAPAPGGLSQAHQPLRGSLSVGAAGRRTGAVFEVGDARYQRRPAEQSLQRANDSLQREIAERVRTEAQLLEARNLAQQRERLADIGAITAKIVHDLGNPLAALSMQAQLILRRAERGEAINTVRSPAERILSATKRLDNLVREFMDFAREQRLDLRAIDLPPFLQDLVDMWLPVASDRDIALMLDVAADTLPVRADEEKLRRVLDNLVKNAVEAVDRGPGRVHIAVRRAEPERVRISVADTGPGIAKDLEVFRLFETTKPHGSGLGLAVARQIVLAHGGGISFSALQPHGTVFHVELPCHG